MSVDFANWPKEERRRYLIEIRQGLGMIQENLASHIGMSLRAYSDLETGKSECRPIHLMAAERVALHQASLCVRPDLLPDTVRSEVIGVAAVFFGDRLIPIEAYKRMQADKKARRA